MANDAPVDRQIRESLALALRFLDLVFAERPDVGGEGEAQDMRRHGLGDRQQPHRRAIPPGTFAGTGDALLDPGEIGLERAERIGAEPL